MDRPTVTTYKLPEEGHDLRCSACRQPAPLLLQLPIERLHEVDPRFPVDPLPEQPYVGLCENCVWRFAEGFAPARTMATGQPEEIPWTWAALWRERPDLDASAVVPGADCMLLEACGYCGGAIRLVVDMHKPELAAACRQCNRALRTFLLVRGAR